MLDLRASWVVAETIDACLDLHEDTKRWPDGTGGGGRETWHNIAEIAFARANRENRNTWALSLDALTSGALAETDPEKLRESLVLIASLAIMWATKLDSEKAGT